MCGSSNRDSLPHGATAPLTLDAPVAIDLLGGGQVRLLDRFEESQRLWLAKHAIDEDVLTYAAQHGRPIRYRHVGRDWPLVRYQTVFGREPGSAEMPSASRPFTDELVTNLITRGVQIAPLLLHTGVSSLEGSEAPYPERYKVPASTAAEINDTRARGGQVIAIGTTVVRAVASVTDERGRGASGSGLDRDRGVGRQSSAFAGRAADRLARAGVIALADAAGVRSDRRCSPTPTTPRLDEGFLWHEFGDSHLLVREPESGSS